MTTSIKRPETPAERQEREHKRRDRMAKEEVLLLERFDSLVAQMKERGADVPAGEMFVAARSILVGTRWEPKVTESDEEG